MKRMNFPGRRTVRRAKAEAMAEAASKLTTAQKLAKAKGTKERARLAKKLAK